MTASRMCLLAASRRLARYGSRFRWSDACLSSGACLAQLLLVAVLALGSTAVRAAGPSGSAESDFFESKVRPLLIAHCYECHSEEAGESAGQLRLDTAEATRRGGTRGPALVPGDAQASLLLRAVTYEDADLEMPPDGRLPDEAIAVIRAWIESGAPDPRSDASPSPMAAADELDPSAHWSFQPALAAPGPDQPAPSSRDVIDAVVAERLRAQQLSPAAYADRPTLARRLYFDLTGLPAPPEAVERFAADARPDAYQRMVDRLLASPEFGERFGRYWMDVARYADTVGYALAGRERRLTGSERYRDWTINAFNADLPYDQMILYQLAADRLDPENAAGHLDALGFLTVGRQFLSEADTVDDRIDVISRGLLGLTVACARCHDHKYDPIPTEDYYSLVGVMQSSERRPDGPSPLMLVDKEKPADAFVLIRGQRGNRGDRVPRRFLTVLSDGQPEPFTTGSGRLDLARQIASADNPLTARVMVNRLWGHLIGRPLVLTESDFGFRSEPPVYPEVLDELAVDFTRDWSVKRSVRRIVGTHIYGQDSAVTEQQRLEDPENLLLSRGNRRRRDFESLRDSLLVVSGSLQRSMGGEPVDITSAPPSPRRTVYAFVDRQNLPGVFRTFDFASPDAHTPSRPYTTVPQQSLYLMNNPVALEAAIWTVQQVRREMADASDSQVLVDGLFRRVLGRPPSEQERQQALALLRLPPSSVLPMPDPQSLWQYGYGRVRDDGTLAAFKPLEQFRDGRWQAGDEYPDPQLRYVSHHRSGGHPGSGAEQAAVRRWVAPADGEGEILGTLAHRTMKGNGVRLTIAVDDKKLWQRQLEKTNPPFGPVRFAVRKGQAIDFVADDRGDSSHDSFEWKIAIHFTGDDGQRLDADSEADFSGPRATDAALPLGRDAQLAHVLLMTNEFIFVD